MDQSVGERFARALLAKDWPALESVLSPELDFRGLTPGRSWEATGARQTIDTVFTEWFAPTDEVTDVLAVTEGSVEDRRSLTYRFVGRTPDGPFVCEQTAYYSASDGRVEWLRVLCTGFLPTSG